MLRQPCVIMMNATVNNGEDEPPFDVAIRTLVLRYGAFRVLVGALRQMRPRNKAAPLVLSAHLLRDIGLVPMQYPSNDKGDYGPDRSDGSDGQK
jgi:hypothetical protein